MTSLHVPISRARRPAVTADDIPLAFKRQVVNGVHKSHSDVLAADVQKAVKSVFELL